MPDRADAVALLREWVGNRNLRKHMYAVEGAVRHYARLHGEDEELWGLAGLLHDLDWERFPEEHPLKAVEELRARGYPPEVTQAILAHRSEFTGVEPEALLDKVLLACDELSGLVVAASLVRPNGIDDLAPKSVRKKMKDRSFAAAVSREEIARGMELLGVEPATHIGRVIEGVRSVGAVLGIRGVDRRKR